MAGKNTYYYWQGKGKWIRPDIPNQWGNRTMILYPNDASLAEIRTLIEGSDGKPKIKSTLQQDEDGQFIRLSRPVQKIYGGKPITFGPPDIFDSNNVPLRNIAIGNGSDVTVKVLCYPYGGKNGITPGRGLRWEALKVDNLVPFEGKKDFTEQEAKANRGLPEQPPQTPSW